MTKENEYLAKKYAKPTTEVPISSIKVGDRVIAPRRFATKAYAAEVLNVRTVKARINGRWSYATELTLSTSVRGLPIITKRSRKSGKVLVPTTK